MIEVKTNVSIVTKARLQVLYRVIYELAESFGAEKETLDSITKGVLQKQIISKIYLKYYDKEDNIIGKITFSINWEKHLVFASTDYGKEFQYDSSKSLLEQLASWTTDIVNRVNDMQKEMNVIKIRSSYEYVESIRTDKEEYKQSMDFLGHVIGNKEKEKIDPLFARNLELILEHMKELTIKIESK